MRYFGLLLLMLLLALTSSYVLGGLGPNRQQKDGPAAGPGKFLVRGVPASKAALYDPTKPTFECLYNNDSIDFKMVNDDFCDCEDGSDEPGTSACPNGYFYCRNNGYKGYFVPSGWVNDAVCDCCDGSDEYMSDSITCRDNCKELADIELKETEKNAMLFQEGGKIRDELIEKGKNVKVEAQEMINKLKADILEAERVKKEMETMKVWAENNEKDALKKYEKVPIHEEKKLEPALNEEILETAEHNPEDYFNRLDLDQNGVLTISELQEDHIFDKNNDAEVSREEVMYFLNNKEEVNLEEFTSVVWLYIKPLIMKEEGLFKPPMTDEVIPEKRDEPFKVEHEHPDEEQQHPEEEQELPEEEHEHPEEEQEGLEEEHENLEEESEHREEENERRQEENEHHEEGTHKEEEKESVQYDPETEAIINQAKKAREDYQRAERAVLDLHNEIRQHEERVQRDYGPNNEFAPLDGQCFDYDTSEYTYSLCLFGKITQRSKSGGSEVNLGQWNSWIGGEGDHKYTKVKFDRGLTCWNGPARSTIVTLSCSTEHMITSVSEPNRCEYAMEFATPAACNMNLIEKKYDFHDSSTWRDTHEEL
ncbi:glucosidase 2 subunit beta [Copidosoma floridanum]|uniref:glucosidase 2 subunit beta n=1 Tax=Copidosoma floridanum TaxID=29053 RepID=UPI0006C9B6A3|nr:glucosidase 2 subunit beta [Copidosoma floridanum]XP_014208612.1 glucosidase 2 subunit beta [Copidosoma floridanum]